LLNKQRIVMPGTELATIEEYTPGEGVYVDRGIIKSSILGQVYVDFKNRTISVRSLKRTKSMPKRGETIHAYVTGIPRDDIALLKIFADENMNLYKSEFTGILHISQASDKILKSIYDVIKISDILRASVLIGDKIPYVLSIRQPLNGVVLAFCSLCGATLRRVPGTNKVGCPRCGNIETRKISPYYIVAENKHSLGEGNNYGEKNK